MKLVRGYTGRPFEGRYGAYRGDATDAVPDDGTSPHDAPDVSDVTGKLTRRQILIGGASLAAASCFPDGPGPATDPGDPDDQAACADGDLPPEFRGDPVFLNGTRILQPGVDAGQVNEEALRNPFPFPIEILEIRLLATSVFTNTPPPDSRYFCSPMSQVGVSLSLGDTPVTQDAVPANLLCPGGQLYMETQPSDTTGATIAGALNLRLSHPLILRPKELLACMLQHRGVLPNSITVNVGYIGRTRQDLQGKLGASRRVPYITAWVPSALQQPAYNVQTPPPNVTQSSETDLQNKLSVDMHVDYMIGRLNAVGLATAEAYVITELTDAALQGYAESWPSTDMVQLAVWDNQSFPTIAEGTPFRLAFGDGTRIMKMNAVLSPGDYFIAQVSMIPPDRAVSVVVAAPLYAGLSVVGWREVAYG